MRQNFDECLAFVLKAEGGFSDHAKDPGGATNMGVTRATLAGLRGHAVSIADVRALTLEQAASIYRSMYWRVVCGDELPGGVDIVVFDHAVNSGSKSAIRTLQRALGFKQDGRLSRRCIEAAQGADHGALVRKLCAARMNFLRGLSTWLVFRRGWTARLEALERAALALCVGGGVPPASDLSRAAAQNRR